MQIPPVTELEETAKKLVWAAKKKGTLKTLTPRLIRQTIEKQLGLEEASLDASEYKSAIKSATKSALDEDPASEEEEILKPPVKKVDKKRKSDVKDEEDQPTPKSKRKKSAATTSKDKDDEGSVKKKRKTVKAKKVESEQENSDSEEASPTTTTKKKRERKRKETKQFKSLEHVPTSDMEEDEPGIINIAGASAKVDSLKKKKEGSPLPKKVVPSKLSKETPKPESKPTDIQQSAPMVTELTQVVGRDVSSELSELDDPTPKKKAKASNKEPKTTKTKGKEKEKKSVKTSPTLTKDEETVKRLKSLVLACGVRKVWSKVFQDLDSPNQQIKKLKEILAELGMTGRMSMDQAKMIKQKRELAKELEDVQEFEKAVLGRSSRSRSQNTAKVAEDDSENDKGTDSEEDEDEDEAPKKRPNNARKSIMAFLQDQSDEE